VSETVSTGLSGHRAQPCEAALDITTTASGWDREFGVPVPNDSYQADLPAEPLPTAQCSVLSVASDSW